MAHRVGGGAGWAGDRIEPAVALAASGAVDDVVLECLAERTLVAGLQARRSGGNGWDPRLRARMEPLLPLLREQGVRVVSNLGAADPAGAAKATAALAEELGVRGLRVAAVLGDDVTAEATAGTVAWRPESDLKAGDGRRGDPNPPLDPLRESAALGGELLGAHAYTGSTGIAEALADGADVVLCGRAADSALFAGPLRAHLDADDDALAGALAVGHLLECSGQVTGGNHEWPGGGRLTPAELADLGYPLAEVAADGSARLRVCPGKPGRIDRLTATLQLLYEVHDPSAYVTPDGVVDFTGIVFTEQADASVGVAGARMTAPPPQRLKVSGFVARPGLLVDAEIGFAGAGALDRARDAAEVMRLRLGPEPRIDLVGVDSVLGAASSPLLAPPPELRVHVATPCPDADAARLVEDELIGLTISGPAAAGGIRSERRPHLAVVDGRLDRDRIREEVVWA